MEKRTFRDRIREVVAPPVLTQDWVDMVAESRSRKADRIENARGPKAAERYRSSTEKVMKRMTGRKTID